MQHLYIGTQHSRAHSNTACDCLHCKKFDYADTLVKHINPTIDNTLPARSRSAVSIQEDDCIQRVSIDTETLERVVEYVDQNGNVVLTQTRPWAYEPLFARKKK